MRSRGRAPGRIVLGRIVSGAACAVLVVSTACSGDVDRPAVAEAPTTTTPTAAADLLPSPPPDDAAVIAQRLRDAAASGDFCTVLAAIDSAEPAARPAAGVASVYRELAATATAARSFAPAELRTHWAEVVTATEEVSQLLSDNGGDAGDPRVEAALSAERFVDALAFVERYELTTCPAPTPAG